MADILIKNMELPKDRGLFLMISSEGIIQKQVGRAENGYPIYNIVKEATAIELPSHGRLVDESVILDRVQALLKEKSWMYASHAQEIIDIIRNAPTVIEASK